MTLPLADKLSERAAPAGRLVRAGADRIGPPFREAAASWARVIRATTSPGVDRVARYQDDLREAAGADPRREVARLNNLASTYRRSGDLTNARVCATRALEVARGAGDLRLLGLTLNGIGLIQAAQPAPTPAIATFEEARAVVRRLGDRQVEGQILANLGTVHDRLGARDRARATWAEALATLADDSSAFERLSDWLAAHPASDPAEDETADD